MVQGPAEVGVILVKGTLNRHGVGIVFRLPIPPVATTAARVPVEREARGHVAVTFKTQVI